MCRNWNTFLPSPLSTKGTLPQPLKHDHDMSSIRTVSRLKLPELDLEATVTELPPSLYSILMIIESNETD